MCDYLPSLCDLLYFDIHYQSLQNILKWRIASRHVILLPATFSKPLGKSCSFKVSTWSHIIASGHLVCQTQQKSFNIFNHPVCDDLPSLCDLLSFDIHYQSLWNILKWWKASHLLCYCCRLHSPTLCAKADYSRRATCHIWPHLVV